MGLIYLTKALKSISFKVSRIQNRVASIQPCIQKLCANMHDANATCLLLSYCRSRLFLTRKSSCTYWHIGAPHNTAVFSFLEYSLFLYSYFFEAGRHHQLHFTFSTSSLSALSKYGSASCPEIPVGLILSPVIPCPVLFSFLLKTPNFCLELISHKPELEYT